MYREAKNRKLPSHLNITRTSPDNLRIGFVFLIGGNRNIKSYEVAGFKAVHCSLLDVNLTVISYFVLFRRVTEIHLRELTNVLLICK